MLLVSTACALLLVLTTVLHYEVLRVLSAGLPALRVASRGKLLVVIFAAFFAHTIEIVLYAFLACLLIRAVFSWIEPYPKNSIHIFVFKITEPFLAPVRRLIPPIGGFDIAFVLVFFAVSIILQLVQRSA